MQIHVASASQSRTTLLFTACVCRPDCQSKYTLWFGVIMIEGEDKRRVLQAYACVCGVVVPMRFVLIRGGEET